MPGKLKKTVQIAHMLQSQTVTQLIMLRKEIWKSLQAILQRSAPLRARHTAKPPSVLCLSSSRYLMAELVLRTSSSSSSS